MIAESAKVKNTKLGEGTKIWDFANVYGAVIGGDCTVGAYVEIQSDVKIGNGVTVSSHSFICSLVTIEDNVFVGHGVMTVNDLFPPSRKRTGSDSEWRETTIRAGATIGSNATLLPVAPLAYHTLICTQYNNGCTSYIVHSVKGVYLN